MSSLLSNLGKLGGAGGASNTGGTLSDILGAAKIGSTGYNLYNQYENQQYENKIRDLASNPAKLAAYAAQFEKPLTAGLTSAVGNNTQSYLASRGLSSSPQISQEVEAQAIAPYVQQEQQDAYKTALEALQLGEKSTSGSNASSNALTSLSSLLSNLGGSNKMTGTDYNQLIQSGSVPTSTLTMPTETDYSSGFGG
jgi:hypothetical protein